MTNRITGIVITKRCACEVYCEFVCSWEKQMTGSHESNCTATTLWWSALSPTPPSKHPPSNHISFACKLFLSKQLSVTLLYVSAGTPHKRLLVWIVQPEWAVLVCYGAARNASQCISGSPAPRDAEPPWQWTERALKVALRIALEPFQRLSLSVHAFICTWCVFIIHFCTNLSVSHF